MPEKSQIEFIKLKEDIHEENVDEITGQLENILQSNKKFIAIDCSNVQYLYSIGIRILLRYQKKLKEMDGELYMFNLNSEIQKILNEINLFEYLNGFDSEGDLEGFLKKG